MKYLLYLSIAILSICSACAQGTESSTYSQEDLALRRDIAQMFLVGFRGTELNEDNTIVRDVREYGIGGVILFEYDAPSGTHKRNIASPEQLSKLTANLQVLSGNRLLIGIDQEGGKVNRLKESYGFPRFISAEEQAKKGEDSVLFYANLTGKTLHELGINLDFAPCVDVNTNPECPIIGKLGRSFSSNPNQVARYASIWCWKLHVNSVIPCLKHFPGHGSSMADTHKGLADVTDTWNSQELIPYKELIGPIGPGRDNSLEEMPYMIMTTHVYNAQLDTLPATLSKRILTDLLRDSLGYGEGVIVTDDLGMGAMVDQYSYEEIIRLSINAGADLLCLANNGKDYNPDIVPQTLDMVFKMVKDGLIPEQRIHESARRIRNLKSYAGLNTKRIHPQEPYSKEQSL